MTTPAIAEINDATFITEVLERSREIPVVVDFWAPWCGPCRLLGPILERLAAEHAGQVRLVKLNVDESPQVAGQLGISSIPAVIAFRDGRPVDQFVGAVPEAQARQFFEGLLPTPADRYVAEGYRARAAANLVTARAQYESALALDPAHPAAALGLAEVLFDLDDLERAEGIAKEWPNEDRAKRVLGLIRFRRLAQGQQRVDLEARLAQDGADAAAHYALAAVLAGAGEWRAALDHLLTTVRLDRSLDNDGARRGMVELFAILGESDPLTQEYRRELSQVLF